MCCVTSRVLQSRSLLLPICIAQTELLPEIVSLWILHPSISKMLYENPAVRLFQDNVPHFIQFVHEYLCGSCSQVSTNWSVWSLHVIFKMAQGRNCIQTFIRCLWYILYPGFYKMTLLGSCIVAFSRWSSADPSSKCFQDGFLQFLCLCFIRWLCLGGALKLLKNIFSHSILQISQDD